jgi:hypothetical protein
MILNIIFIVLVTIVLYYCLKYEAAIMNCYPGVCDLETNSKKWEKDASSFPRHASQRTNWMRAFIITYMIGIFLWILYYRTIYMDLRFWFILLISFFTIYFYLNFDSFHYAYPACKIVQPHNY